MRMPDRLPPGTSLSRVSAVMVRATGSTRMRTRCGAARRAEQGS